jgi:hypothetical protein
MSHWRAGQTGLAGSRRPDFFIVGAPKCGTTLLHATLARHPDVFMAAKEETNHFATDLLPPGDPWRSREAYLALFRGARGERRVGESSVFHLFSREAAANLRAFDPDARILALLRNPVDWVASYHSQMVWNGDEDIADLAEALAAEEARRRGERVPARLRFAERLHYGRVACFSEQLERYFGQFGRAAVRVILYDDLARDPARVYRETLEFLGVDPAFVPPFERVNPNREVRSARLSEWLRRPPGWLARPATALLPRAFRRALRRGVRRWNSRVAPRAPLSPALRRALQERFRPEVLRLSELLGRDLSAWLGSGS